MYACRSVQAAGNRAGIFAEYSLACVVCYVLIRSKMPFSSGSEISMSETVINQWLSDVSRTVAVHDHAAHMALISRSVSLLGVPGYDNIGYEAWSRQCKHEFANQLIANVDYGTVRIRVVTDKRIKFMTYESVTAHDGNVNTQGIECLLEKEDDGKWRLVQERILADEETRKFNLEPAVTTA